MTNLIVLPAPYGKYMLDGDHIFSNNLPTWQPFTYLVTICLDGDYPPDVYINQMVDICQMVTICLDCDHLLRWRLSA